MKICIDASSLLPPRTGIGAYTFQLVRRLLELDSDNRYALFLNSLRRPVPSEIQSYPNVDIQRWRVPGPLLHRAWQFLRFPPVEFLAGRADLFHAPATILAPSWAKRKVATLHDCYFMIHPEECHALGGRYLRRTVPGRINRYDAVICVSDFTAREARRLLRLPTDRIRVIHSGVDTDVFHPMADDAKLGEVRRALNLPQEFMLTVATLEPRKNLEGLCRALAELYRISPNAPPMVCAGARGFQNEGLGALIRELHLEAKMIFLGFVEHDVLPALYSMCLLSVIPSRYEGFGLPVLEAMACGAPVLASKAEALAEVGGDAACYADIDKAEGFAEAMAELLESKGIQQSFRAKGSERVKPFTWQKTARKTLEVYRELG